LAFSLPLSLAVIEKQSSSLDVFDDGGLEEVK
jgi:hypothetical protein